MTANVKHITTGHVSQYCDTPPLHSTSQTLSDHMTCEVQGGGWGGQDTEERIAAWGGKQTFEEIKNTNGDIDWEKRKEEILFNSIRVFRVSFFQNRPYWKAHRGAPTRGLPSRGARIFQKKSLGSNDIMCR